MYHSFGASKPIMEQLDMLKTLSYEDKCDQHQKDSFSFYFILVTIRAFKLLKSEKDNQSNDLSIKTKKKYKKVQS